MKRAKKLLALLLVLALALALAIPAFAAEEGEPTFWEKTVSKIKCMWEEFKAWLQEVLIRLGLARPPDPPYPPFDPDNPYVDYKPVIYLYPEEPMEISVTLQTIDAHFTETIPAYNDGWRVLAQPDGTLTNLADGEQYPYLFWEAERGTPWSQPKEGFVVARGDLAGFLEEKLLYLGLNEAEAGEFLEYWLPRLAGNAYTLLYFSGEEYRARYPLEITPAPDSLLRVFMVAKAAKGDERIAPQKLVPFERKGFAVIEWGGTIV
ncbi:MAG: hypothetical protein FWC27_10795 [Firmicutes bacterium]|nr:hypothetical protein [Bacillota bacterium]